MKNFLFVNGKLIETFGGSFLPLTPLARIYFLKVNKIEFLIKYSDLQKIGGNEKCFYYSENGIIIKLEFNDFNVSQTGLSTFYKINLIGATIQEISITESRDFKIQTIL